MVAGASDTFGGSMVATTLSPPRRSKASFYVWMAAACALVAVGGFLPTYWFQMPGRTFVGPPLLHLHVLLFYGWIALLLSQTILAARGRLSHHRAWGMAGIALASAMVVVGIATAIHSMQHGLAAGYGDRARAFFIVPMSAIALFAGFFIAAVANLSRPETHKRLMLLATVALLPAALARIFFTLANGSGPGIRPGLAPPISPTFSLAPTFLVELLVVAAIVYDWRTRGRPHPVWLIGAAAIITVVLLGGPVSATPQWLGFADWMAHIAG